MTAMRAYGPKQEGIIPTGMLGENFWFFRNKFVIKSKFADGFTYKVYNKYSNAKLSDFCFECHDLKSLIYTFKIFEEETTYPVVRDLDMGYER